MGPLHVALVVDSGTFGAAELYTTRLLRHLPGWVRRSLVVNQEVAGPFLREFGPVMDVKVVPLAKHASWAPEAGAALADLAPDVVQVNLADPASNLALVRAAESVAPTVATLHGGGATDTFLPDAWQAYRNLAGAVAPTNTLVGLLKKLGVRNARRILPGVEIPDEPVPPRRRTPVVLGAIAPLVLEDGLDLLVRAVAQLRRRGRPIQLLLAGSGPDRAALIERTRGLPVRLLGPLPDSSKLLRRLDIFCEPDRWEALPYPLLEALAHGLPAVTTAIGSTMEVLAGAATIVPSGDADALTATLERLVLDDKLRAKLAPAARAVARREFDVRVNAARTAEVLVESSVDGAAIGSGDG
ncbi:glycosyltransferase family 4 protein [Amycolatopsis acidicola]|uniref:Glycosyltransferase family 4 protein n=1 Tax=Amycolatopsis acidicola TaxID=2596893 RepID=A0A5N0V7Z3_9PSEU|nr:glycosyltransferase family 4 protein [Amycolatopsis acidicola]KAA9161353.1 glycosyltransferase family 4 protein [Amycolatopsis acidicola]